MRSFESIFVRTDDLESLPDQVLHKASFSETKHETKISSSFE